MDNSGLDAWIPGWAQSAIVAGGVLAGMIGWVYKSIKNSTDGARPEINASRSDVIDVLREENRENRSALVANRDALVSIREGITRLIDVTEGIARRAEALANDTRSAEIAERVARRYRDDASRVDRARHERDRDDE